jgi:hypothetical protein
MNIFRNRQTALQDKKRIEELENELKKTQALLNAHTFLTEFFDDTKQMSETERKKYVSDIALSYVTVFKKQFPKFIFDQQQALSVYNRPEKEYDIYRCNINVIRLFEEWMIKMTNEHLGDLEESRNKVVETEDFINNLRGKYEN